MIAQMIRIETDNLGTIDFEGDLKTMLQIKQDVRNHRSTLTIGFDVGEIIQIEAGQIKDVRYLYYDIRP